MAYDHHLCYNMSNLWKGDPRRGSNYCRMQYWSKNRPSQRVE